ncbi:MAG: 2-hydroxyacyl-CoA dehydratase subunit D [Smithellaceae bacterium]
METLKPKSKFRLDTTKKIGMFLDDYYERIRRESKEGKLTCWTNGCPVFPIVRGAEGVNVVFAEAYAARCAARDQIKYVHAAAEEIGFLPEFCSYVRTISGGARLVAGLTPIPSGGEPDTLLMPKPDIYVGACGNCGTNRYYGEYVQRTFKIPSFNFEFRRPFSKEEEQSTVDHLVRQMKDLIVMLEQVTGKPYNWDALSEQIAELKATALIREECFKLCSVKPAPASAFDWITTLALFGVLAGVKGTAQLFQDFKGELEARVANGVGAVPNEKYRLAHEGTAMYPVFGQMARKFAKFDACVVAGMYSHLDFFPYPERLDPNNPLEGIAYNITCMPYLMDNQTRLNANIDMVRKYDLDGIVLLQTATCRPNSGPQLDIVRGLEKAGIPAVVVPGDVCDISFYNDAQADTRIQALLETIDARRAGRAA